MASAARSTAGSRGGGRITLTLCALTAAAAVIEMVAGTRPVYARAFAPQWVPVAAAIVSAAGVAGWGARPPWGRVGRALVWSGLLLMIWAANGLPLDVLRLTPLMPPGIDWLGMATRALAAASAVMLARLALARPVGPPATKPAAWYGYAAFVLALPYPVFRTAWAFGATLGLDWSGAAGRGWEPWLASIPWQFAAALSLLLVPLWRNAPRRPLLAAGWFATLVVAMFAPAALWTVLNRLIAGADLGLKGIHSWVALLFYGSWFLWGILAAAATRSYQLRFPPPSAPGGV